MVETPRLQAKQISIVAQRLVIPRLACPVLDRRPGNPGKVISGILDEAAKPWNEKIPWMKRLCARGFCTRQMDFEMRFGT
jgi:hypothetical protein